MARASQRKNGDADTAILRAFFSDESAAFRIPCEPAPAEPVSIRLRVEKQLDVSPCVLAGTAPSRVKMERVATDDLFTWYEARLKCGLDPIAYRFVIEGVNGRTVVYQKDGAHWADETCSAQGDFRIVPGLRTPAWCQGVVQYQIFPDRFASGDSSNNVADREYAYNSRYAEYEDDWDAPPTNDDYRCFRGGDLQGVMDKLDYLQSLGVEAIYLNPIFVSPSSHKYDTQDYLHIDPHFGTIVDDVDHPLEEGNYSNREALQYVRRTTSPNNLEASDALFADLCREIHRRGMKIILDGAFNHCGSYNAWMDREGIYQVAGAKTAGAFLSPSSPYRRYFNFTSSAAAGYEAWWDFPTLPKLNYEASDELCDRIIGIARHWARPPYSIDGWRLDVAADLGHSESFNHRFWRRFRGELKGVNPELVILAEHYGDPSAWLKDGDQWDTVMNYDAFMEPLTFFLTGMEKHSDGKNDSLYQDGAAFCATMRRNMARFAWGQLLSAMNELSNHDHSRFLTRTNRTVGRLETAGSAAAGEGVDKRVMREAVVVQMTWPGAPTIYYGDEAGQVGWTDPDCRRTYPWGHEDQGLLDLHRELAAIRRKHPALRDGSLAMLDGGEGWIAFGRFLKADRVAVVCNNAGVAQTITVRVRELGVEDGCPMAVCLQTTEGGFATGTSEMFGASGAARMGDTYADRAVGKVKDGMLTVTLAPRMAMILIPDEDA